VAALTQNDAGLGANQAGAANVALPAVPSDSRPWVSRNGSADDRRRPVVYNGIADAFAGSYGYLYPRALGGRLYDVPTRRLARYRLA
jgi:hypothetical protein